MTFTYYSDWVKKGNTFAGLWDKKYVADIQTKKLIYQWNAEMWKFLFGKSNHLLDPKIWKILVFFLLCCVSDCWFDLWEFCSWQKPKYLVQYFFWFTDRCAKVRLENFSDVIFVYCFNKRLLARRFVLYADDFSIP